MSLSLSLSFILSAASLERSYLTYSHRQRQKSLIIVNAVDLVLKFVLAGVWILQQTQYVSKFELIIESLFCLFLVLFLYFIAARHSN